MFIENKFVNRKLGKKGGGPCHERLCVNQLQRDFSSAYIEVSVSSQESEMVMYIKCVWGIIIMLFSAIFLLDFEPSKSLSLWFGE